MGQAKTLDIPSNTIPQLSTRVTTQNLMADNESPKSRQQSSQLTTVTNDTDGQRLTAFVQINRSGM